MIGKYWKYRKVVFRLIFTVTVCLFKTSEICKHWAGKNFTKRSAITVWLSVKSKTQNKSVSNLCWWVTKIIIYTFDISCGQLWGGSVLSEFWNRNSHIPSEMYRQIIYSKFQLCELTIFVFSFKIIFCLNRF